MIKRHIYALTILGLSACNSLTGIKELPQLDTHVPYLQYHQHQLKDKHDSICIPSDILSCDYKDLVSFSKTMSDYANEVEEFEKYFEEALFKSLEFYKSFTITPTEITRLIEQNFYGHSSLSHQIKRPQIIDANLPTAFSSLDQFSGIWHGSWREMLVHHLWLPVRRFVRTVTESITLIGFQSCFTGDGFGWNYVLKHGNQIIILGFTLHFDDNGTITSKNPHYAFLNNSNQLIWVSEDHIYYEFICDNSNCSDEKHYVISGAAYEKHTNRVQLTSGFQTVYLPRNEGLPPFKSIDLNKSNL